MTLRKLDPRFNPMLRPHEWAKAKRWMLLRLVTKLVLLTVAVSFVVGFFFRPVDRTEGMSPEGIAEAAGLALLGAEGYRFWVDLQGEAEDHHFPTAGMVGRYQRSPAMVHLAGTVTSGETRMNLEYYLAGGHLYLRDPKSGEWTVLRHTTLPELRSLQPENLAAPLVSGVKEARIVGRESMTGGEAVILALNLDHQVMAPQLHTERTDGVEYRLWVNTRTLEPVRFTIAMKASDPDAIVKHYSYTIRWDFAKQETLVLPPEAANAVTADSPGSKPLAPPRPQQLPPPDSSR